MFLFDWKSQMSVLYLMLTYLSYFVLHLAHLFERSLNFRARTKLANVHFKVILLLGMKLSSLQETESKMT